MPAPMILLETAEVAKQAIEKNTKNYFPVVEEMIEVGGNN